MSNWTESPGSIDWLGNTELCVQGTDPQWCHTIIFAGILRANVFPMSDPRITLLGGIISGWVGNWACLGVQGLNPKTELPPSW